MTPEEIARMAAKQVETKVLDLIKENDILLIHEIDNMIENLHSLFDESIGVRSTEFCKTLLETIILLTNIKIEVR